MLKVIHTVELHPLLVTGYAMKMQPALLSADEQLLLTNEEDGVAHFLQERFLYSQPLHTFGRK